MSGPNRVAGAAVRTAPKASVEKVSVATASHVNPADCDIAKLPELAFKGLSRFHAKAEQVRRTREKAKTVDQRFVEGSVGIRKFIDSKMHLIDKLPKAPKVSVNNDQPIDQRFLMGQVDLRTFVEVKSKEMGSLSAVRGALSIYQ